jgi:hypothetical protein
MNARQLRMVRRGQVAGFLLSGGDVGLMLRHGLYAAALPAFLIVVWLVLICVQTRLIQRREWLDRPRPDYSAIAAMERDIYGETFAHEGAPKSGSVAELHAMMDDLAERAMRGRPPKHECVVFCGHGPARAGGMCAPCYRQEKVAGDCDCGEHPANFRWERPS